MKDGIVLGQVVQDLAGWTGIMIEYEDPFGKHRVPGWLHELCGKKFGTPGGPPTWHECSEKSTTGEQHG